MNAQNDLPEPSPIPGPEPARRKLLLDWRLGAAAIVVIVTVVAWRAASTRARAGVPAAPPLPVAVSKVVRRDLARELNCVAELRPNQEVELHAKVGGYLQKIGVDIGDQVEAGQWLASIEVPELADDIQRARAALKRNEEEVTRAQATADETHTIYTRLMLVDKSQPNLIAQQELDTAHEKELSSASTLAAARAEVDVAKAELSKLQTMQKYSQITAPFSGVITKRYVDPGALIQSGTSGQSLPLVRLSQNDRLRLDIPVSVSHISWIQMGDPVEVHVDSLAKPFTGKIARSTRKVDTATRTMEVEVDVPNSDLKLIPGMYASVLLRLEHRENALCVPIEAVSRQQNNSVFLVGKSHRIEAREVSLGLETPDQIEVLGGLGENDLVIVGNHSQCKPGREVEPKIVEHASASPAVN